VTINASFAPDVRSDNSVPFGFTSLPVFINVVASESKIFGNGGNKGLHGATE
jgi:hypothetical protein